VTGRSRPGEPSGLTRRGLLGMGSLGLLALAGCATPAVGSETTHGWHGGQLAVGTGNTTGNFYQVGGGYADLVTRHLPGYEVVAAPTSGSADNLKRLARGDVELALTFSDVAADAVDGSGSFANGAVHLFALARLYNNVAHCVVVDDPAIRSVADLKGRRVSTGTRNSGTELVALRLLDSAGLDPDRDLVRRSWSLAQTTDAMLAGQLDALFWSGGVPTIGITDLFTRAAGKVKLRLLPLDGLRATMNERHGGAYLPAVLPAGAYPAAAEVPTLAIPTLLVVGPDMPDQLAYDLTRLMFDYHDELVAVHPELQNVNRTLAPQTEPVVLHPGAQRYYSGH
jgi:TRAP transporter TAXI family solute receptor